MNPDKLRDTYGKLIYLLQDANAPWAQEDLELSLVLPIRTVRLFERPTVHFTAPCANFTAPPRPLHSSVCKLRCCFARRLREAQIEGHARATPPRQLRTPNTPHSHPHDPSPPFPCGACPTRAQVHVRLKEAGALALLQDDLIATATQVSTGEKTTDPGKDPYIWMPLPALPPQ
eukprot:scaffold16912_cov112-Isochrysis_galbana.AAC.5